MCRVVPNEVVGLLLLQFRHSHDSLFQQEQMINTALQTGHIVHLWFSAAVSSKQVYLPLKLDRLQPGDSQSNWELVWYGDILLDEAIAFYLYTPCSKKESHQSFGNNFLKS